MRKNLPQRAPGYPYFDTSRDHIGSSPHMSSSLCGTCTACCCSDLYTHTKRRETRFIGLLSWCKQFHFCFGLKYVTFSKKWHDDKVHVICFHCGQSVSIRSRSSIQKEKSARLLFPSYPGLFRFLWDSASSLPFLRSPLFCFLLVFVLAGWHQLFDVDGRIQLRFSCGKAPWFRLQRKHHVMFK